MGHSWTSCGALGIDPGLAFLKYFILLRIFRHYKVIALALGAPGVGAGGRPADPAPTGDPEMLAQLGTTRSWGGHYKVIGRH